MAPLIPKAQSKYFEYLESKGLLPKKEDESEAEITTLEDDFDYDMADAEEYDLSEEPIESEHPMEYMSRDNRVPNSDFAKALRKSF